MFSSFQLEPTQPEEDVLQTTNTEALTGCNEDVLNDYVSSILEVPAVSREPGSAQFVQATDLTGMAAGPGAGDKVIHSYVTSCKIGGVQEMLKKESHCHRSTLKLLPLFFSFLQQRGTQ